MPEREIVNGHGSNIETLMAPFIAAVLRTGRLADAAREVGISISTAKRWFVHPEVRRVFLEAQHAVVQEAIGELANSAQLAISTLISICTNPEAPHSARVAAARAILDQAFRH